MKLGYGAMQENKEHPINKWIAHELSHTGHREQRVNNYSASSVLSVALLPRVLGWL
jgi:hypothetical protein